MMTLTIHPATEPTRRGDMAPTTTIVLPSSARLGAKADRHACAWFIIRTERPWLTTSTGSPWPRRWSSLMSGEATTISIRTHATVCHRAKEWARDDNGDGIREVHVNTTEGMWTTVRNFLRPFRGVHKRYLAGYVSICEFGINLKRITPPFISALVALH
jgi:hypothetical protein